jgi:poly(hydroxyalkanoate) depolymerase family esterase
MKPLSQWLRGLNRAGRAQQRSVDKLVKQLLRAPAGVPKPRVKAPAKPKPKPKPKPKAAPRAAKPRPSRVHIAALPGRWLAFCYMPESAPLSARHMNYWLYLPDKAPPATRAGGMPMVVMLHGCEQSATEFAQGTRMNRLAEQKGYAVLYPQQSLSAHAQRCWKWYDKATQEGGGEVRLIAGTIEQVAERYPIDRSRIYICGISAGAAMANIVALHHPDLIAALGLHSGPAYGAGHGMINALSVMQHGASGQGDAAIAAVLSRRPAFPVMPTILIQGAGDTVVRPINQTHLMRQSLLLNRMPADTAVSVELKPAGRGNRNPANAHQIRDFYVGKKLLLRVAHIEGLDHAWSGGDATLAFNAKAGPDASKMLLDFFSRQRRLRPLDAAAA